MLPTLIVPALIIGLVGFIIKGNDINISDNDIILSLFGVSVKWFCTCRFYNCNAPLARNYFIYVA